MSIPAPVDCIMVHDSVSAGGPEATISDSVYRFLSEHINENHTTGIRFSWAVSQIEHSFPEGMRPFSDDDFPSSYATGAAKSFLGEVDRILDTPLSISRLEGFEGDLILHWNGKIKGVCMVFPARPDRTIKLYREELDDKGNAATDLVPDPRPSDVASFIKWMRMA